MEFYLLCSPYMPARRGQAQLYLVIFLRNFRSVEPNLNGNALFQILSLKK